MSNGQRSQGLFLALYVSGVKREIAQPALLLSQSMFICLVLFIFSHLWKTAFASGFSGSAMPADYVWYLLATEMVVLGTPQIFREMQEEVRSGDVMQRLLKPLAYPLFALCDGCGRASVRIVVLGLVGLIFALIVTGRPPGSLPGFAVALALVPFAAATLLVFHAVIGLLAVWMFDSIPVYWVFSKCMFLLGGLMIPVSIYPLWLQWLSAFTPFYAMLYGVGRHVSSFSLPAVLLSIGLLAVWAGLAALLTVWLYRRVTKTIALGGG